MKKAKIGVLGVYRGTSMIRYCELADNAEVVAICDNWEEGLRKQQELIGDDSVTYYTDFDEFIKHDMDAVVLANYAHQHAAFAIKAMKEGKHVYSEVLPAQTMKEAIELIEAVEETGKIYAYGENYCFMPANTEMKRLYREGKIGKFEYGEGEYIHNCESDWHSLTYGDPDHWRNWLYSTFYCTHSLGPIVHITGKRPASVIGMELSAASRLRKLGARGAGLGIEFVTFEDGTMYKSMHGGLYKDSVWYEIYGSKGRMESAREDTKMGDVTHIYVNIDEHEGDYAHKGTPVSYKVEDAFTEKAKGFGHGGSDFYAMYNFAEKVIGNPDADIIDVYEAMDMFLPGMFAFRSILKGNVPMEIPNLRNKADRDKYRNDTACTDKAVAGDMLLPTMATGTPDIPQEVYDRLKEKWENEKFKKGGRANTLFYQMKQDKQGENK